MGMSDVYNYPGVQSVRASLGTRSIVILLIDDKDGWGLELVAFLPSSKDCQCIYYSYVLCIFDMEFFFITVFPNLISLILMYNIKKI